MLSPAAHVHLYSCESKLVCTCAQLPPSWAALASAARSYARAAAASVAKKPRCTCGYSANILALQYVGFGILAAVQGVRLLLQAFKRTELSA